MSTSANRSMLIDSSMRVMEIITLVPGAADIMAEYGLHCFSCSMGGVESLEEGCAMHSMDSDTLGALVEDLNDALGALPDNDLGITVTVSAARIIASIAKEQDQVGDVLRVVPDMQGGFCLEFFPKAEDGDQIFTAGDEPDVKVCIAPLYLRRIGGAVIDEREGRLKLDLPGDGIAKKCCGEDGCGCS